MHPSYREWRERQQEEIAKRDEESKARRQETISKAERALDNFYEEYTAKRKAQIAQNKCVLSLASLSQYYGSRAYGYDCSAFLSPSMTICIR